jgi:hypothetical protein
MGCMWPGDAGRAGARANYKKVGRGCCDSMYRATTHVQLVALLECHLLALSAKHSRQLQHSHKFDQG